MSGSSNYDEKSPPLYPSDGTDRFNPLGFGTPQQQHRGHAAQARDYYSAQPKHMLPRTRGFHHRHRASTNDYHDRSQRNVQQYIADDIEVHGTPNADTGRQNYNRNWRGQQHRNQRWGGQRHQHSFRQKHQIKGAPYNIDDYFHPSMLEDPWEFLIGKSRSLNDQAKPAVVRDSLFRGQRDALDSGNSEEEG